MHRPVLLAAHAVLATCGCLLLASPLAAQTSQQQRMTSCNAEAESHHLSGQARKSFMSSCLARQTTAAAPSASSQSQQQKMKDCNASASGMKGSARKDFIRSCLSGSASAPPRGRSTAGAQPSASENSSGWQWPWQKNTSAPSNQRTTSAPAAQRQTTGNAPAGANEAAVRAQCGSDAVVWVNTNSRIYHFQNSQSYGHT
jgi:hypothetical protein